MCPSWPVCQCVTESAVFCAQLMLSAMLCQQGICVSLHAHVCLSTMSHLLRLAHSLTLTISHFTTDVPTSQSFTDARHKAKAVSIVRHA